MVGKRVPRYLPIKCSGGGHRGSQHALKPVYGKLSDNTRHVNTDRYNRRFQYHLWVSMSSLFGQPNSTSSLFGAPTTSAQSQAGSTTSLFGNPNSSQPQSSSTPSINIFGTSGASQPPKQPSLSSNLGGATSTPSLFAPSQPQQPASSDAGASLFVGLKPATSSLFGGPSSGTTSQPVASSLFGTQPLQQGIPLDQTAQGEQQQQDGQQGQPGHKARQPAYFENLLEKGRKRTHDADGGPGFRDFPRLQLGLSDIAKRVRELGGVGPRHQGGKAADSKAHYLLAASGVNPGITRRDLGALAVPPPSLTNLQQRAEWDPDTHKHVEQLQQQSTLKMISESLERAQQNFDAYLEENVDINWELQRKKIYNHFGLMPKGDNAKDDLAGGPGGKGAFGKSTRRGRSTKQPGQSMNRSIFGHSALQKSVIGAPGVGMRNATLFADVAEKTEPAPVAQDDRFLREKQRSFADKVQSLNRARLDETPYPVLRNFKSVESQPGGESPRQLADAYDALVEIAEESKAKERQYANDYLDEIPNSAKAIKTRKRVIDGSRRCLEKAFFEQLENVVARNHKEANLGGVPTTINKVRAYIRIRALRKDLIPDGTNLKIINDDYCWALVFFLLRSGLVKEATEYVTSNKMAFTAVDRNFGTYITGYVGSPDRRLDRKLQDHMNREYQVRTRVAPENQNDPYQIACYKIIGRCDLSKRSIDGISQGVEDWIWLQFCLAREFNRVDENAGEVFGLEEVRETIREIGQRHFSKGAEGMGGYATFFFLQILGGMFEQAVSYLYNYSYVAAVHFAIALDYYGLLRVSDFSANETDLCKSQKPFNLGLHLISASNLQHQGASPDQLWQNARLLHT